MIDYDVGDEVEYCGPNPWKNLYPPHFCLGFTNVERPCRAHGETAAVWISGTPNHTATGFPWCVRAWRKRKPGIEEARRVTRERIDA